MVFSNLIARQLHKPHGLLARLIGNAFEKLNRDANAWTVSLLNIQPTDHVLEIGYGTGMGIEMIAEETPQGFIAGIDHSMAMCKRASKRNKEAIAAGRVQLICDDCKTLPFDDASFDAVMTINTVHFWDDPVAYFEEIYRVLCIGGKVAIHLVLADNQFTQTAVFTM